MSSGAGVIVLAPVALAAGAALAVAAVPIAAVYGLYKGGQALYDVYAERAEERRRVAEAVVRARLKAEYDVEVTRIARQKQAAADLEVAPASVSHWSDQVGPDEARVMVTAARAAAARLERGVEEARAALAQDMTRLEAERKRRTALDQQADTLRIARRAGSVVSPTPTTPSLVRPAVAALAADNEAYATALRTQTAEVQAVQVRLAQAHGYQDLLARSAADSGATAPVVSRSTFPDLSVLEEAEQQLAEVLRGQERTRESLHEAFEETAVAEASRVFDLIRPPWTRGGASAEEPSWRTSLRSTVKDLLDRVGDLETPPGPVVEALAVIEASSEREARSAVTRATHALTGLERRRKMLDRVLQAAQELAEAAPVLRSEDLARRCAAVLAEVETHDSGWTDSELSDLLNVRIPGLHAELGTYVTEEARQERRRTAKRIAAGARDAVSAMRDVLDDSPSWQVIELDDSTRGAHLPTSTFTHGFIAREVGDLTTALLVRMDHDGRIETLHRNLRTAAGKPDEATQRVKCTQVANLIETVLAPTAQAAVGDEFVVNFTVDPGLQGTYRPTTSELGQMTGLDDEIRREAERMNPASRSLG
jgi:hypothetical protein